MTGNVLQVATDAVMTIVVTKTDVTTITETIATSTAEITEASIVATEETSIVKTTTTAIAIPQIPIAATTKVQSDAIRATTITAKIASIEAEINTTREETTAATILGRTDVMGREAISAIIIERIIAKATQGSDPETTRLTVTQRT